MKMNYPKRRKYAETPRGAMVFDGASIHAQPQRHRWDPEMR